MYANQYQNCELSATIGPNYPRGPLYQKLMAAHVAERAAMYILNDPNGPYADPRTQSVVGYADTRSRLLGHCRRKKEGNSCTKGGKNSRAVDTHLMILLQTFIIFHDMIGVLHE